ncbi:hypothetical protein PGT21_012433 [Puccinia graminis f. sp. tritici]|uniref:Uncharacterized protein n=1 Tax=Puccinia graminis f. sp. tritici TaxID=56615 RepID=A0A5B0NPH5_PUCGR|nr:hypothetical protein PGT21_012433 [Puccinia graminis f. sp. tritici]
MLNAASRNLFKGSFTFVTSQICLVLVDNFCYALCKLGVEKNENANVVNFFISVHKQDKFDCM